MNGADSAEDKRRKRCAHPSFLHQNPAWYFPCPPFLDRRLKSLHDGIVPTRLTPENACIQCYGSGSALMAVLNPDPATYWKCGSGSGSRSKKQRNLPTGPTAFQRPLYGTYQGRYVLWHVSSKNPTLCEGKACPESESGTCPPVID
jgi:hypothetical protein